MFYFSRNIELKLFKLKHEFKNDFQFQSRIIFVSLLIENLTNNNINYIINDNKDTKSLLIQEPGLNCI
jgi:hypothetical protein